MNTASFTIPEVANLCRASGNSWFEFLSRHGAAIMPAEGRVQDKVAIVTGAGSGIGRATAILLASEGANVVAVDISTEAAHSCVDEIYDQSGKAAALVLDVANENSWKSAIGTVLEQQRRLDILINNAGISFSKAVAEWSLAGTEIVLDRGHTG